MPRLSPDSVPLARIMGAGLLLAGLLYAVPAGLMARDRAAAEERQRQLAGELAISAEAQARRGLQVVERALFAAQRSGEESVPPGLSGDLLREIRLLQPGEEADLAGGREFATTEAGLLLGTPRPDARGGWVLPALRPPERAGGTAALALLDPEALLAQPPDDATGSRTLLLGRDGVVRAEAGRGPESLGRSWPEPVPAADRLRIAVLPAVADGALLVQAALPVQGSSLTALAVLPLAAPGWLVLLPGLLAAMPLLGSVLLLLAMRQRMRQQQALALANARFQEASAQAAARTRQLAAVLEGLEDGAALLDSQLRFLAWNSRFAALAGLTPATLRPGLPVAELLNSQSGSFHHPGDHSLRQRLAGLQARVNGAALRRLPGGGRIEDRWTVLGNDGLLLTCRRLAEPAPQDSPAMAQGRQLASLCAEELRKRLPLLQDAALAGDSAAARMESHAMRGVAANFGLKEFAESLRRVEEAAREGDHHRLRATVQGLPVQLETALALLPALVA